MERKVVKHGVSSYILSLPIKWVRKWGLKAGDSIFLREDHKALVVTPEQSNPHLRIEIDGSKLLPRLADRFLARSYQKGYDEIVFIHNNPGLREIIKAKISELIGYELVDCDSHRCVIRAIAPKIELDFDQSLQRAFHIVKEMLNECQQGHLNHDPALLLAIEARDVDVNRLCYFCLRQINKEHYDTKERSEQSRILYYLVEVLEDLGDAVKKLAKRLAAIEHATPEQSRAIVSLLALLLEQYSCSHSYFYMPKVETANKAYELHLEITKSIEQLAAKPLQQPEILSLIVIQDITNIVYHFTTMRLDYLKSEIANE